MTRRIVTGLLVLATVVCAQHRVDPRNTYRRILVVVPYIGTGTAADPVRPQYAPWPLNPKASTTARTEIMAYMAVPSDDKKSATVEFVAQDMAAFSAILADKKVHVYVKGQSSTAAIETAFASTKQGFKLDNFGVVIP